MQLYEVMILAEWKGAQIYTFQGVLCKNLRRNHYFGIVIFESTRRFLMSKISPLILLTH